VELLGGAVRSRVEKLEEIAKLAQACREAQIEYFHTRSKDALITAKEQERMLDDALAWLA
jgi:hypothetical protein